MNKVTLFWSIIFASTFTYGLYISINKVLVLERNSEVLKQDTAYLWAIIDTMNCINIEQGKELIKWNDHSTRMKKLAGVPDTVDWSFKIKCMYPVNTRSLLTNN